MLRLQGWAGKKRERNGAKSNVAEANPVIRPQSGLPGAKISVAKTDCKFAKKKKKERKKSDYCKPFAHAWTLD